MKKENRPTGREKKVTAGTAQVYKRGEAAAGGKPVGMKDGYAERQTKKSRSGAGGGETGTDKSLGGDLISGLAGALLNSAGNSSKKAGNSKSKLLRTILIIAIVVFVGYYLITMLSNKDETASVQTDAPQSTVASSTGSANTAVALGAKPKRTIIKGNGKDVFTIMIFMCGTDLESQYGMATADLNEILSAKISDKVNIIVETGGTTQWKNSTVSSATNQRYQCTSGGLKLLQDDLGKKSMTDPNTLSDFIQYSKKNFPANRYALIFWDHGGGSINGYGYDQNFPGTSMTLDKIDTALKNGGCEFDFVGFDACLMATLENAMMLGDYADYLIASEETEPGIGWYYTDWVTQLSKNTSLSTVDIGKAIIDSFVETCGAKCPRDKATLSITDLAELSGTLPPAFTAFASSTGSLIDSGEYQAVADARGTAREFGQQAQIDQIDLIHFAQKLKTNDAAAMIGVLDQCIKYNRASGTISNANGMAIYFPYGKLTGLNFMLSTYDKIGMDLKYRDCITRFANLEAGGQIVTSGDSNPLNALLGTSGGSTGTDLVSGLLSSFIGGGDFSSLLGKSVQGTGWVDPDRLMRSVDYYEQHYLDNSHIVLTEKDGGQVLSLSEEEWGLVQDICLNVFIDDGDGYIDLGLDNVFELDDDGNLKVNYDGTWLAIDGHAVSYYFISQDVQGDEYTITGRVPARLNGQLVDIIIVFTNEHPEGVIAGARIVYSGETDTVAKGLAEIQEGDEIDFLCDYYTYDGEYSSSYLLGEQMIADEELTVSNMGLGDVDCMVTYQLTDIYQNTYWTPAVTY